MAKKLKTGFFITEFSDISYEKMTIEIQYEGEQIAQINMDKGLDNLEIEIFTEFIKKDFKPVFQVDDFLEAMREAASAIKEYSD